MTPAEARERLLALELGVPLLGRIQLDPELRIWGDRGEPLVSAEPGSDSARELMRIAEELVALKRERGVGIVKPLTVLS